MPAGDQGHLGVVGVGPTRPSGAGRRAARTWPRRWRGRCEELQVDRPHDGEDAASGRQQAELAQLAGRRHPHLGHHPLGAVGYVEERQREADEVVQVARRRGRSGSGSRAGGEQLLGRGLAGRAGDAHQLLRTPLPRGRRRGRAGPRADPPPDAPSAGAATVSCTTPRRRRAPGVADEAVAVRAVAAGRRRRTRRRERRGSRWRRRRKHARDRRRHPAVPRAGDLSHGQASQSAPPKPLDLVESEKGSFGPDDLLPLVTLARHQHGPARTGGGDGLPDRLAPVRHHAVGGAAARPQPSSIAARIASGSSLRGLSEVAIGRSPSRRRPGPSAALAGVAVAAAAEDDRHFLDPRNLAGRAQGGLQRGVGVRVVHEDRERLAAVDRLQPSRDWPWPREPRSIAACGRPRASAPAAAASRFDRL